MAEWQTLLVGRGLDQLSPPEVAHVLLELPAERAAYTSLLSDLSGWPERSPLARRTPGDREVHALDRITGRWRAICLLDDTAALRTAALLFQRVFVLDPLYDSGDLLYAAWHDPTIRVEHARRLAEQAALLVAASSVLRDGTAVLAPDHLPGSWDPRPGWRRPRPDAAEPLRQAWALRGALVLLNWADRLDAVVVVSHAEVARQLPVALGRGTSQCGVVLPPAPELDEIMWRRHRANAPAKLRRRWTGARTASRRRAPDRLQAVACALAELATHMGCAAGDGVLPWQLALGQPHLPEPALLLRRVLNGEDPQRLPELPPTALRRRPLCLVSDAPGEPQTG